MSQAAACACGQVLFDVGDKKPNDALTCPWCDRKYRYLGQGKVEPWDTKESSEKKAPEAKSGENARPPVQRKSGSHEKKSADPKTDEDNSVQEKFDALVRAKRADAAKKPKVIATARHDPTLPPDSPRVSVRKKRKGDIPGGVGIMVGFIVVFNGAAFIALHFLLPALPDGSRTAPWGAIIPKTAIWPEIAALLLGHFIGFIAWSTYLYFRQQRHAQEAAAAQPPQPAQTSSTH